MPDSPLQLICQTADAWERLQHRTPPFTPEVLADALGEHLTHQGIASSAADRRQAARQVLAMPPAPAPTSASATSEAVNPAKVLVGGLIFISYALIPGAVGLLTHDLLFAVPGAPMGLIGLVLCGRARALWPPRAAPSSSVTSFTRGDD